MNLEKAERKIEELENENSVLKKDNESLTTALVAQEGFDDHYQDCDECENEGLCATGEQMWDAALDLRSRALGGRARSIQ